MPSPREGTRVRQDGAEQKAVWTRLWARNMRTSAMRSITYEFRAIVSKLQSYFMLSVNLEWLFITLVLQFPTLQSGCKRLHLC